MRACFMGQNVTALGFGVAILHSPRLPDPVPHPGEMPVQPEGQDAPLPGENAPAPRLPEPA